jgi:hypothetical protein
VNLNQIGLGTLCGLVLLLCTACGDQYKCSSAARGFVNKPLKEQLSDFGNHGLEEQYEIYLCGTQAIHPPLIHLAEPFARDGTAAVGFLKGKLANAQDDATIQDIVMVFSQMSRQRTYDVAADADLMQTINKSVGKIKDDGWRKFVAERVNEIALSRGN